MRRLPFTVGVALVGVATLSVLATTTPRGTSTRPAGPNEGSFEVQALADGFWLPVAELWFGERYSEEAAVLPAAALSARVVRVRLVQHSGGAAHVDRISLGDAAPIRLGGASEPDALALVQRADHDVLDAFGRTLELTFPAAGPGASLHLNARVEGPVVVGSPFAFPPSNRLQPMTEASAFYRYRPTPGGHAPSWPESLDPAEAFFAERCTPTTGHPEATTWGWVANDRDTLYAAVEFTPDNTRDGEKDWAGVQVATAGGIREFRVSEGETRWGTPAFAPTARAAWHHKLYRFAIPFSELGVRNAAEAGELKLAFSAYGTAAVSWLAPNGQSFGPVAAGTTSAGATFTITNGSAVSMTLGNPWFTRGNPAASPFPVSPGTCGSGVVLSPGGSCTFQAAFAPTSAGYVQDTLTFYATFGTAPQDSEPLFLSGTGFDTTIPSLGSVGLAALALVLGAAGLWALRRA